MNLSFIQKIKYLVESFKEQPRFLLMFMVNIIVSFLMLLIPFGLVGAGLWYAGGIHLSYNYGLLAVGVLILYAIQKEIRTFPEAVAEIKEYLNESGGLKAELDQLIQEKGQSEAIRIWRGRSMAEKLKEKAGNADTD